MNLPNPAPAKVKSFFKNSLFLMGCLILACAVSCSPRKKEKNTPAKQNTITCTLEILPRQQEGKTIRPTKEESVELVNNINNRLLDWDMDGTATLQGNGTITFTLPDEGDPEEIDSIKKDLISCRHIELLPVHINNQMLIGEGTTSVPGYKLYNFVFTDDQEKEHAEKLFLSKKPIITSDDIKTAESSETMPECLNITLTTTGSEKMKNATSTMNHGTARLAIVIDGKVISAPVVQAALSAQFQISGLDQENEPAFLETMLNYPLKWKVRFIDEKTKDAPQTKTENNPGADL